MNKKKRMGQKANEKKESIREGEYKRRRVKEREKQWNTKMIPENILIVF